MNVTIRKLTDVDLLREILSFAYNINAKMDLSLAYRREHTPIRSQLFLIKMEGIKSKVSVHLVRHSAVGQFHLVGSNRHDWNCKDETSIDEWDKKHGRDTPVNHVMILNAGHLIDMAKKRLCNKAEKDTRVVMNIIKEKVSEIDPDLAQYMVPTCMYRNGICPEPNSCGLYVQILKNLIGEVSESVYRNARNEKAIHMGDS